MIINSKKLLIDSRKKRNCIPAFNVYNLETVQAAFNASKEMNKPIILAFGESYIKHTSLQVISAMVKEISKTHSLPVVLHLDHCKDINIIVEAMEAGFSSVMYDGSYLPFEENITNTRKVVELAKDFEASVEGELGSLNPEDGSSTEKKLIFTDPNKANEFVKRTGIDSLAVSIGNAHGLYKGTPNLNFERLQAIYDQSQIPLVLHGSSGIPANQLDRAINMAISKINVNTEIALTASAAVEGIIKTGTNTRFEILMAKAQEEMKTTMINYLKACNPNP